MKDKPIIIPLDGIKEEEALSVAEEIKDYVWGVKLNDLLDLKGIEIIKKIKKLGLKVFADPKIKDIPSTVSNRIKHYDNAGADLVTIFADGGIKMIEAAKRSAKECKVLVVSVLTSLSNDECIAIYNKGVTEMVLKFADDAREAGADGIVCSPHELRLLHGNDKYDALLKVTPGIRPLWYSAKDDQSRVMPPKEALDNGADLLVIGRPILKAPDRIDALKATLEEIKGLPGF
ncbi:MAG: orotidine-5'-phosphate decarboxylase [bacterium]